MSTPVNKLKLKKFNPGNQHLKITKPLKNLVTQSTFVPTDLETLIVDIKQWRKNVKYSCY